jgi:hypothetical protein
LILQLARRASCAMRQRTQQQQRKDTFHGHSIPQPSRSTADHFDDANPKKVSDPGRPVPPDVAVLPASLVWSVRADK